VCNAEKLRPGAHQGGAREHYGRYVKRLELVLQVQHRTLEEVAPIAHQVAENVLRLGELLAPVITIGDTRL
jgi:hypothetical protein